MTEIFLPFFQNPEPLDEDGRRLLSSLQRIKTATTPIRPSAEVLDQIQSGCSSVVRIALDSESNPIAVKRAKNPGSAALNDREAAILRALKHPLVLRLRARVAGGTPSLVTEYAGNGSLASFLASDYQRRLPGPNQIAKVIAGIALAMRFVHSRGTIRRDLKPENM